MKCGRNRQLLGPEAFLGQDFCCSIDFVGHTREDYLTRRIVVRHHQIEVVLLYEGQHLIGFIGYGQH